MNIEEFDYELKEELIAQTPLLKRDESRLLILDKNSGEISHAVFKDIASFFSEGDVLVLNNTKVLPARLIGLKEETNAVIEVLLLKNIEGNIWECLLKPAKRIKIGTIISFGEGKLKGKCLEKKEEGIARIELIYEGILVEVLEELGTMPLPPYIHEKLDDQSRYQTVYAKNLGSAAAPTAGLHFTEELLNILTNKGVIIAYLTLHVGLGTFRPVMEENILDHKMHSEYYELSKDTSDILNNAKKESKKIVVVGTTSVRVLETIMKKYGKLEESSGWTDIFIYPGYEFLFVENLITNFHLPKSTLLMLVSALATKDYIKKAYQEAISNDYRFFSFGDAMFIKK